MVGEWPGLALSNSVEVVCSQAGEIYDELLPKTFVLCVQVDSGGELAWDLPPEFARLNRAEVISTEPRPGRLLPRQTSGGLHRWLPSRRCWFERAPETERE